MRIARALDSPLSGCNAMVEMVDSDESQEKSYSSPVIVKLGHVREVTLGSSSSGNADANSQYYW
jgi:hypothetical protein